MFAICPACALALDLSGIAWEGAKHCDWPTLMPNTHWRELSALEVPEYGIIGHELAILSQSRSRCP